MSQAWTEVPAVTSGRPGRSEPANLVDILERVLDKGIVIAGDIRVDLLDIELLTVRLRLLVASVERAKEMGIDWWEHDPTLSSSARELTAGNGQRRKRPGEREISAAKGGGNGLSRGTASAPRDAGRSGGRGDGARRRNRDELP